MEVMAQVQFESSMNEKEINPDEVLEVKVDGITYPCVLSYEKKALFDETGEEICNTRDIDCELDERALKALMVVVIMAMMKMNFGLDSIRRTEK